eukprot:scaffold175_cov153-Cylindrotheca_fusiformis.AAC.1
MGRPLTVLFKHAEQEQRSWSPDNFGENLTSRKIRLRNNYPSILCSILWGTVFAIGTSIQPISSRIDKRIALKYVGVGVPSRLYPTFNSVIIRKTVHVGCNERGIVPVSIYRCSNDKKCGDSWHAVSLYKYIAKQAPGEKEIVNYKNSRRDIFQPCYNETLVNGVIQDCAGHMPMVWLKYCCLLV